MAAGFALSFRAIPLRTIGISRLSPQTKSHGLFLPAAGNRWKDDLNNAGSNGNYWSSLNESNTNNAWNLNFNSGNVNTNNNNRNNGQSVRPVRSTYHFTKMVSASFSF